MHQLGLSNEFCSLCESRRTQQRKKYCVHHQVPHLIFSSQNASLKLLWTLQLRITAQPKPYVSKLDLSNDAAGYQGSSPDTFSWKAGASEVRPPYASF